MCRRGFCFYLLLLLFACTALCQRQSYAKPQQLLDSGDEDDEQNSVAINVLPEVRHVRLARPAALAPKRAAQGSRFALSLDVPTSILSVLIDLAKNHDMRAKAAANAELMARIGKRK
ncbi:urocortin-3-like [Colossoma macropomum]|uniref:urocortin-3-like n=1 Tax=Colossoma macropomum TaxID=42526 RepID=UPI001864944B|nr:urocortin-3-like [Colossoma macropomum]